MRRITIAATALAALSVQAAAADLSVKAPLYAPPSAFIWSGFGIEGFALYGVNFGGTNTHDDLGIGLTTDLTALPHGPGIGGGFWYFYQPSPGGIVFGLRAEIAWANLQSGGGSNIGLPVFVSNATNYLGNADGCLGLSLNNDGRLLGYGCAGFGFGGAKPNLQVATLQQATSDTSTGWNVGLGLKYALTPNWIIGIEGDYYKLGDKQLTAVVNGAPLVTSDVKFDIFVQKFTIGYKF